MILFNRDKGLRKPKKYFDGNGLRYDISYLNKVFIKVVNAPIKEQAQFVDKITYCMYKDPLMKAGIFQPYSFDSFNTTSIGNLAFMVLNHPDQDVREYCADILNKAKNHFGSK
jgi:hypothetical protein